MHFSPVHVGDRGAERDDGPGHGAARAGRSGLPCSSGSAPGARARWTPEGRTLAAGAIARQAPPPASPRGRGGLRLRPCGARAPRSRRPGTAKSWNRPGASACMIRAILSKTRRSSSSAPSRRAHLDHVAQRAGVGGPDDVGAQSDRRQPAQRRGDLLLDVEGHALLVDPELLSGADLELLELLDDREHLLAHRLERRRHAKADVGQAHVAQALLAERRAGAMPNELVREHAADVAQRQGVVGVLEHAAVRRAQDVGEVLALVGADLGHVRVQARLPAAVAGAPAELDEQLAAVGLPSASLQAPLAARTRRRRRAGSRAYPRASIEGRAIRKTVGLVSCIGRTMLGRTPGVARPASQSRTRRGCS